MPHPLEPLVVLQNRDRKLIKLMREVKDIPQRKSEIEAQLSGAKEALEQALDKKMHVEASLKEIEVGVESLRDKIAKYKTQQLEVKTNDQYRALIKEIAAVEKEISDLEDNEIVFMETLEAVTATVKESEERLSTGKEHISEELAALDERAAELSGELERQKAERARCAALIEPVLLKRYTRIMNNKRDYALVLAEADHCGGCHMKLPPQVMHDARNPTKIVSCNFCGRIVYYPID